MRHALYLTMLVLAYGCGVEPSPLTRGRSDSTGPTQPSTLFRAGVFTLQLNPIVVGSSPGAPDCQAYAFIGSVLVTDSVEVYQGSDGMWRAAPTSAAGGNGAIVILAVGSHAEPDGTFAINGQITGTLVDMTSSGPPGTIPHDVSAVFPSQGYAPTQFNGTVSADGRSANGVFASTVQFPVASKHATVFCANANSVRWTLQSVSSSH